MTLEEKETYVEMVNYIFSGMLADFAEKAVLARSMFAFMEFCLLERKDRLQVVKDSLLATMMDISKMAGLAGEN